MIQTLWRFHGSLIEELASNIEHGAGGTGDECYGDDGGDKFLRADEVGGVQSGVGGGDSGDGNLLLRGRIRDRDVEEVHATSGGRRR